MVKDFLFENVFDDLFIHSHDWLNNTVLFHANPISKNTKNVFWYIFSFTDAFSLTQTAKIFWI